MADEECTVTDETAATLADHRLKEGDILFARRGDLGRCGLVTRREEGWLCGTGCLRLRVRADATHAPYLLRLLSIRGISEWLHLESVGATMENVNTAIIGRIPVVTPPLDEQDRIVVFVDRQARHFDVLLAKTADAIERLKELRTAVISAAVTGKIDVRQEAG